jgi:D-lactate dehydrogenase (cytochrome)
MKAINAAGLVDRPYPVQDTLFFKIQGDLTSINLTSKTVNAIVQKHGSTRFEFASTDEEAEELWQNRKYALTSTMAAEPGSRCWTTDVWYVQDLKSNLGSSLLIFT